VPLTLTALARLANYDEKSGLAVIVESVSYG
jgi:hypothetical protein